VIARLARGNFLNSRSSTQDLKGDILLMPTGPKHVYAWDEYEDGKWVTYERECRCMLGNDHHEPV